ncbi:hypothetical protein LINGRAHAP2_LOCUS23516 [Linum grandiflorum]
MGRSVSVPTITET